MTQQTTVLRIVDLAQRPNHRPWSVSNSEVKWAAFRSLAKGRSFRTELKREVTYNWPRTLGRLRLSTAQSQVAFLFGLQGTGFEHATETAVYTPTPGAVGYPYWRDTRNHACSAARVALSAHRCWRDICDLAGLFGGLGQDSSICAVVYVVSRLDCLRLVALARSSSGNVLLGGFLSRHHVVGWCPGRLPDYYYHIIGFFWICRARHQGDDRGTCIPYNSTCHHSTPGFSDSIASGGCHCDPDARKQDQRNGLRAPR